MKFAVAAANIGLVLVATGIHAALITIVEVVKPNPIPDMPGVGRTASDYWQLFSETAPLTIASRLKLAVVVAPPLTITRLLLFVPYPEEEAVMLLKQVSDLGLRLGLDVRLWKPGAQAEDPSKLFIRMPINVEVAGGYHTAAIFFDRISKLSRIVTVQDVRIGAPRVDQGRVVTQTVFDLVAYAAPQEKKFVTPVPAAKPK